MAPISLVSILPVYSGVNTRERNGCHAPLLSDYSSTSKCLLVRECDVALEWYRTCYCCIFSKHFLLFSLNFVGLTSAQIASNSSGYYTGKVVHKFTGLIFNESDVKIEKKKLQ